MNKYCLIAFFILISSLLAEESPYLLLDPKNLLSIEQKTAIEKNQQKLFSQKKAVVSYCVVDAKVLEEKQQDVWQEHTEDIQDQEVRKMFHVLVILNRFGDQTSLVYDYKNAPVLDDLNVIERKFKTLKKEVQSEIDFEYALETTLDKTSDTVNFVYSRPKREQERVVKSIEAQKEKEGEARLKWLKKILIPLGAILLLAIFIKFVKSRLNKKPYQFPLSDFKQRLGAEYGVSVIKKINRKQRR